MRRDGILLALALVSGAGCASTSPAPPKTQLEIREYQTREFDTSDSKLVMKAMLNVLQDEGFMVRQANSELGFLSAQREIEVKQTMSTFFNLLLRGKDARYEKNSIIEVTVNVSARAEKTRVRANFQLKVMDNAGAVTKVRTMSEAVYYQEFFAKVDKAIFLEKERL